MCYDYLKSFIWVLDYYILGLPSWRWSYRWHYAPLMSDFSQFLQELTPEEFKELNSFPKDHAPLPFVQLLSVLPPPSSELLPVVYGKLMATKGKLSREGYYPLDFEIDYESKIEEYQGIALLPFVDYEIVIKEYARVNKRTTTKKYIRNSLGKVSLFEYDSSYRAKFTSDMGNILNLHVRKKLLSPQRC